MRCASGVCTGVRGCWDVGCSRYEVGSARGCGAGHGAGVVRVGVRRGVRECELVGCTGCGVRESGLVWCWM